MKQFEFSGAFCNLPSDLYRIKEVELKTIKEEFKSIPTFHFTGANSQEITYILSGQEIRLAMGLQPFEATHCRVTYTEK